MGISRYLVVLSVVPFCWVKFKVLQSVHYYETHCGNVHSNGTNGSRFIHQTLSLFAYIGGAGSQD